MTRRAAVYNRFWQSKGGGERHSGKLAEVLAADGWQVDLLGHYGVTRDELAEHLGLDLSGTTFRAVPDRGERDIERLSAEYDLFVNGSHLSRIKPRAEHNLYLCYFPTPRDWDTPPLARLALKYVAPHVVRELPGRLEHGPGWFPMEGGMRRSWAWTQGNGVISLPNGYRRHLRMDLGRPGGPDTELTIRDETGTELAKVPVTERFVSHDFDFGTADEGSELHLVSDTFVPGPHDPRALGVAVSRLRLGTEGQKWRTRVVYRFPWLTLDPTDLSFLESYQCILANSKFTQDWITRLWHRDSEVLYPPIRVGGLVPAPERSKTIVTVGRFFRPGTGHAKRQLEMVQMFGELHRSGRLPGWTLHVLGGVEHTHTAYLREVQAAAEGLPIEIHPNAPRSVVEDLLDEAAIFWSATGLGESEEKAPWNQEHFGMTTVEAMAGGCVPVVIDRAGQREIVRDGVDGFRWSTREEWAERTLRVAHDEPLRAKLAASAVERAHEYSEDAFGKRWRDIAGGLGL